MNTIAQLDSFIADIDSCDTLTGIHKTLSPHLEKLGYTYFTYWLLLPERGPRAPIFISNYPREWVMRYIEQNYATVDIIPSMAASILRPFSWAPLINGTRITAAQRTIFDEATVFGIRSGASVPIHGPGKALGKLSVTNDMKEIEFEKLFMRTRHIVHLMGTYIHERILTLAPESKTTPHLKLSPREMEILTWTAQGKTRWEISSILSISEATVKNHLDHCCRKLRVSNKTHAVAVAMTHALIWP
ncbi:MAG: autoinducer binding domain-containing protein [Alphaproteobacteria bacterium]|nr:autoinducer binding domain-containing protein [Alphaproteobacteria bacterium]